MRLQLLFIFSLVLLGLSLPAAVSAYKNVMFMHGLGGKAKDFSMAEGWIKKAHPGTKVLSLPLFNAVASFQDLQTQVDGMVEFIGNLTASDPSWNDYILIGHSQGGLLTRAYLESTEHKVHTYISLAGIQNGVYGLFGPLSLGNFTREALFEILYTDLAEDYLCYANFWNDPNHHALYLKYNTFLPRFTGEAPSSHLSEYKDNFLRLKEAHFFGSPHDGIVIPWQSELFGFYPQNCDFCEGKVLSMEQTQPYLKDTYGLKTLSERKSLFLHEVSGVQHMQWILDEKIFSTHVIPLLV